MKGKQTGQANPKHVRQSATDIVAIAIGFFCRFLGGDPDPTTWAWALKYYNR